MHNRACIAADEERDLEEVTSETMICDSTVSAFQFDETEYACEVTEEDKKYMKEAIECAKKSPDPQTKVWQPAA